MTSAASKPASSRCSATGSIMPVRMLDAQRLRWPSRRVVSTKRISADVLGSIMTGRIRCAAQRLDSLDIDVGANPVLGWFRRVSLAGLVFGKENISGMETNDRAVAHADVHVPRNGDHPAAVRRAVKIYNVRRKGGADQISGRRVSGVEKLAGAFVELLKMRLAVRTGVETIELHAISSWWECAEAIGSAS